MSLIFFVYLLCSCGRKNDGGIGDIRKIDLAGLSVYNPFIKGNQLDSIKIVKLATDTNCLLGGIIKVIIEDSLIFIRDANEKLFVFDLNGKFRNMIGVMGNGPLEYASLSDFYVNCQKKFVCILDRIKGKIYRYTFDGQYIEEFDCDRSVFNNAIDIHYVGENKLLLNMNNHIGTLYNYALVNESSYKLEQFLHPYPVVSRERISNGMLPTVVYGNGNIFYTVLLSDTIYTIQDGESVSIRQTTGIKLLYTTIATVTMNLIVSAAIVLLNPYVTVYISYKIPPFALSVHIPDVSTSIYVEVDSKVLLGLPFCDKAFVR